MSPQLLDKSAARAPAAVPPVLTDQGAAYRPHVRSHAANGATAAPATDLRWSFAVERPSGRNAYALPAHSA